MEGVATKKLVAVGELRGNTFASGQLIGSELKVRQGWRGGRYRKCIDNVGAREDSLQMRRPVKLAKIQNPCHDRRNPSTCPLPLLAHTRGIIIVNVVEITPFVPPSSVDCEGMKSALGPREYSFNAILGCIEVPWGYPSLNFVICNSIKLVL